MSRRGDNIHKRTDGRWEGRYIKCRNENNKAVYASVYGKTYTEVKIKLDEAKLDIQANDDYKRIKFSYITDLWLSTNHIHIKAATYNKYYNVIETHIKPVLGNLDINEITSTLINQFLEEKMLNGKLDGSGGLSPTYVNTIAVVVNSIVNFAVKEGYCSPLSTPILKPTPNSNSPNALSNKEYTILTDYIKKNTDNTKLGIMLSLYAGLRIGEICALKWNDVDFEKSIIHISSTVSRIKDRNEKSKLIIDTPKTKSSDRFIPVPQFLMGYLEMFYDNRKSEFVISNNNKFVNPRMLEYHFHKVLKEANINQTNFHALRHTFATKCIEVGMDVKSLSEVLDTPIAPLLLKFMYTHQWNKKDFKWKN